MNPLVTVILPTYNETSEQFLSAANSILQQTYKNFKLLIIVDQPKNTSIIESILDLEKKDNRVYHHVNKENMGLSLTLNVGVELADTKYIARMDADDISLPNRLEIQLDYMEKNPGVDLISGETIPLENKDAKISHANHLPNNLRFIKRAARYGNLFAHPTFFGKTRVFKDNKYRDLTYAQDYDFTCRLLEKGYVLNNLHSVVLYYNSGSEPSDKKKYLCSVIGEETARYYRKGRLCSTDIVSCVKKQTGRINFSKRVKQINYIRNMLTLREQGRTLLYIIKALIGCVISNYIRQQIINSLRVRKLRKQYSK